MEKGFILGGFSVMARDAWSADWKNWSLPYWTPREAACLLVELDPKNYDSVSRSPQYKELADYIDATGRMATREQETGLLTKFISRGSIIKKPAYFLCGLLNAPIVREWIESHNVAIQVGDVFKHMCLPEFDATNMRHIELSELVEKAHGEHNKIKRATLVLKIELAGETILKTWMKSGKNR